MSLKPCPCGQTPNRVLIQAEHARPKFAYCGGDCCEDWRIEFRNNYKDVGGRESNALAEAAWNAAPRGVSQREALVAYADAPVPAQPAVVPKHAADWFHDMREVLFDIATSDVICDRPEHAFVTVAIDRDTLSRAAILSATDTEVKK